MAFTLFALAATAYRASPFREILDSKFALLTSESLLTRGSWDLSPYLPGLAAAARGAGENERKLPFQLRNIHGRIVYLYPPGIPLLTAPLFAVERLSGATTLDARGIYSMPRERRLQAGLAALIAAAAVVVGFRIARRELPLGPALLSALVAAFSSGYWSVCSRALWSHTWTAVLLSAALLELLRWEDGEKRRPATLGALLVAAFWARPTNSFSAAAFTLFVAWRHRTALARLAAVGAAGFALYVVYSLEVFSAWFPTYMKLVVPKGELEPSVALVGQFLSAKHGILVFSPVLLAVAWSLVRRGVAPERRAVAELALLLVAVNVVFYAWRSRWWGAGTVGARFLCDITPYLLWLGAHAWRRERDVSSDASSDLPRGAPFARWLQRTAVALLALAGVAAHAAGAFPTRIAPSSPIWEEGQRGLLPWDGLRPYAAQLPQVATWRWLLAANTPGDAPAADDDDQARAAEPDDAGKP